MCNYVYCFVKLLFVEKNKKKKMAATPIYCKNPSKIFFSITGGPISTKLCVLHRGLQPIIVCSNNDARMILTYLTASSNFVTLAFL